MAIIETVKTDTFEMRYFRFGTGDKIFVILPGLSIQSVMNSADEIAKNYACFAEEYTTYVFDRRTTLPEVYTIQDMAEDTAEVIRILGLKDLYVFGASQGGMIAMTMTIKHPELVKKLVLGSTAAKVKTDKDIAVDPWLSLAEAGDRVGLYLNFCKSIYPAEMYEQYKDMLKNIGESITDAELAKFIIMANAAKDFDVLDQLDQITCPVFVIGAEDDQVVGPEATAQMAEKLKDHENFRLYVYPAGYGHAAFDTAPDYKDRMMEFFRD
ncbi:MAG: alpha/beta hydrolase [Solobacterium sp.]|nr:alpha/beta hydrolase [Solobacterium sp.]